MKQIGAKVHAKVFCLQRSLRTFSPSLQLAKLDQFDKNETSSRSNDSQISLDISTFELEDELNIPNIDELVDRPQIDMSAFGLNEETSTSWSDGELNDNFEYLLDKILEEFQKVDVVDMPERFMKTRQWKSKEKIHLYHIVLPLLKNHTDFAEISPKMGIFSIEKETETENVKILKRNRLRNQFQSCQFQLRGQQHRLKTNTTKLLGRNEFILKKPVNFPKVKPDYNQSVPSKKIFEDRLRDILELLDSPVDLKPYLNYPEPSLERSNSFLFDEWESWYQKIFKLVSKMDSYIGGDPDFDLFANRSILVNFLCPNDPHSPIPSVNMDDTYKNQFLVPFFEAAGPIERKLPPSIANSFSRIRDLKEADYPMIFTIPEIAFHMGYKFQKASGKILVIYKEPEDAKKATQMFNSKRFCDFAAFDFITQTYKRTRDESQLPGSMKNFLNTDEYFNNFHLKAEKLSKKDFNAFMKYRDFDLVLSNSRGQLGSIFELPENSPIFNPGPHWKNLSMDRDPYRTDIYREKQNVYFNLDKTFRHRDEFQKHRVGDCTFMYCRCTKMISDIQLGIFANLLGIGLFLMIIAYHWVSQATEAKKLKQN